MGVIGKSFAFVMFPLSILIILEEMKVFSLTLPVSKILVGAVLMILLQGITLFMLEKNTGKVSFMNIVTAIIFIGIALIAVLINFFKLGIFPKEVNIILGIIMFVEALYALHWFDYLRLFFLNISFLNAIIADITPIKYPKVKSIIPR